MIQFKYARPIWIEKKEDGTLVAHERTAKERLAVELYLRRQRLDAFAAMLVAKQGKKRKEDTQKEKTEAYKWMWFEELSAFEGTVNKRQGDLEYKHEYLGEVKV